MNLKDALLCVNCDEVFTPQGSDPRCPVCASSVFAPISAWVPTWAAFEREIGEANAGERRMNIIRSAPIAA